MTSGQPVYVVDDDASLRNSLRFMLTSNGRRVHSFESGEAFLEIVEGIEPGPVLLDVRLSGMSGLDLQQELIRLDSSLPVVMMSGHGDITIAVQAMKAGAVDFLTKPLGRAELLAALAQADARIRSSRARGEQSATAWRRLETLSQREREVLNELARGLPNKSIGHDFGISPRTVEIHRANVMRKLDVRTFPDALRIAFAAGMPFPRSAAGVGGCELPLPS